MTPKSISIKGQGGKSGRCAVKAVVLTSGGLGRVPEAGLIPLRSQLVAQAFQPVPAQAKACGYRK